MTQLAEPARKMESVAESRLDPAYGYNVFLHDGVAYTPDMTVAQMQSIEDFPMDARDVTVVGYPKSGTNWLTIILSRLYPHWESTKVSAAGRVPDLHVPSRPAIGFEGLGEALASPAPRLLKSHSGVAHMPRAFREGRLGRVVYITRNPKDVCDSYFGQLSPWLPEGWGWDQHVDAFIEGRVFFGLWLSNVIGWHALGEAEGILHIGYEAMGRDRRAAVERIVDFLGPVEPGAIDRVLAETRFDAMQTGDLKDRYQPQMLRREGKAGGWKNRFTVAQSEAMDAAFADALRAHRVPIDYGEATSAA